MNKIKDILNQLQSDNKKIYLVLLVFLILTYIDFTFIMGGQMRTLRGIQPKIIKLKKDLDALNRDLAKMQALKSKQPESAVKQPSKMKKLVSEAESVSLLQDISKLAYKHGVQIIQIKPVKEAPLKSEKVPSDKFISFVITLDLVCDYHNFGKFINDLENYEVFVSVQSLKINASSDNYLKQKASLVLKTYATK